jgi:hypothetical protein
MPEDFFVRPDGLQTLLIIDLHQSCSQPYN